jgi:hypothetical protein
MIAVTVLFISILPEGLRVAQSGVIPDVPSGSTIVDLSRRRVQRIID